MSGIEPSSPVRLADVPHALRALSPFKMFLIMIRG